MNSDKEVDPQFDSYPSGEVCKLWGISSRI